MPKSKSIIKNYIYNMLYQIMVIILPIITLPYISRVLGPEKIGEYSFTFSIAQYFMLIAMVGINMYGCRAISYSRDNKSDMSKVFWSIYIIKVITFMVSILAYILFINIFISNNRLLYYIQAINILSVLIDITWFYQGIEIFSDIVIKNTIVKIFSILLIFIFIKSPNDIYKYTFILGVSTFIGQMVLWKNINKYIFKFSIKKLKIKQHITPIIKLFIPQIAIQIYVVLDKTMLGIYSSTNEVAYYDMAIKIIKISLTVVTSLGVVMLPRIANEFNSGNTEKIKKYISESLKFMLLIAIPMMFGFLGISEEFINLFLGNEFSQTAKIMGVISPIIIFMTISNVIGVQCMIPLGKEKLLTKSVIIASIVNFSMNLYLIPIYGAIGASISTVIAEFIVALVQCILMKNYINIQSIIKDIFKVICSSLIMFIFIRYLLYIRLNVFVVIVISIIIYFISLILFKVKFLLEVLKNIKKIIIKKYKGDIYE